MTERTYTRVAQLERLCLPGPKVMAAAAISVGVLEGRWYCACEYSLPTGEGGGEGLGFSNTSPRREGYPSREAAIRAACDRLRWHMSDRREIAKKHHAWLDEIERSLDQPDLFGGLAA